LARALLTLAAEVNVMQPITESVADIMSQPALVIDPDWAVSEVFWLSELKQIHHFPIVDRGALVGIVCTCDLRDARPEDRVRFHARRDVATIASTRNAADAARLMAERAVGSAVVVDLEGIRGIVTRGDLQSRAGAKHALAEGHCAACATHQHLRPGPDGAYLCADCTERAAGDNWFDTGVGD
jgi:acetoin utilization protein AcuB